MYLLRQYYYKRNRHILTIITNSIALLLLMLVNNLALYVNDQLDRELSAFSFDVSLLQIIDSSVSHIMLAEIFAQNKVDCYSCVSKTIYEDYQILCVDDHFFELFQLEFQKGGKFLKSNQQIKAIVSAKIDQENGYNDFILLNGCQYEIVGVIDEKYTNVYFEIDDTVILSRDKITDNAQRLYFLKTDSAIDFSLYLADEQYLFLDQSQSKESFMLVVKLVSQIMIVLSYVAILIAVLSLMNNSLSNIAKEKQEIGIKKAMAASDFAIARQYLFDIVFTIVISCVMAYCWLSIIIFLINTIFNLAIKIRIESNLSSIAFILVIAVLAGLYPAYQANKITILSALKD
ncbi:MAG: ABC transporter permease [Erysipelotrichaceae bacterium]